MPRERLQQEIHIWTLDPERIRDSGRLARLQALLSPQERARQRRYRCDRAAHQYLVAHAMLRTLLSRYAEVEPARWQFAYGRHGRPEIANPGVPPLRFNLTHTAGLVACVVSLQRACGIDAEQLVARRHVAGVARRMFSDAECDALAQTRGAALLERFYAGWTLREAYVKARGIGISFPTRTLDFTVRTDDDISLRQAADFGGHGEDWLFRLFRPTPEHLLAVAIERADAPPPDMRLRAFVFE